MAIKSKKTSKKASKKTTFKQKSLTFVVQKHAASSLHYDFRLEVDGVLKSWAIPKGPSLNPRDKRLAVFTADHDLAYKNFEGVIPQGEYGAGKVMVWDRGTYKNINVNKQGNPLTMKGSFRAGRIEVFLRGKKLRGAFALVRMSGKNWLLIKMKDEFAINRGSIVSKEVRSVKSGRSIDEI